MDVTRLVLLGAALAAAAAVLAPSSAVADPPTLRNAVANGGFERPLVALGSSHPFPVIRGWRLAFGPDIEIQNHVAGDPESGRQFVELDSDASSGIWQRVPTRPGRLYRLQLFFSPRPGISAAENVLVVHWRGLVVGRISADGRGLTNTAWRMYAFKVRAIRTSTRIELADGGISNSVGTEVDAVSVTPWRGHPFGGSTSNR
jgi:hypothetical protein